jgi:hypothetical protein
MLARRLQGPWVIEAAVFVDAWVACISSTVTVAMGVTCGLHIRRTSTAGLGEAAVVNTITTTMQRHLHTCMPSIHTTRTMRTFTTIGAGEVAVGARVRLTVAMSGMSMDAAGTIPRRWLMHVDLVGAEAPMHTRRLLGAYTNLLHITTCTACMAHHATLYRRHNTCMPSENDGAGGHRQGGCRWATEGNGAAPSTSTAHSIRVATGGTQGQTSIWLSQMSRVTAARTTGSSQHIGHAVMRACSIQIPGTMQTMRSPDKNGISGVRVVEGAARRWRGIGGPATKMLTCAPHCDPVTVRQHAK